MENWTPHILYDLADWINGMAFRDINFSPNGRPVIKIAEIKNGLSGQTKFSDAEYDAKYLITKGDMLFCWSGQPETSIGTYYWNERDGWLNQHIFKVLPDTEIVSREFFYHLLQGVNPRFIQIARNKQTTGLGHVTKKDLQNIEVHVPPPEEQKEIAKILSSLDGKIELNRRMNATLEAMARTLFKAWFVDLEPVHANNENRPSVSASPELAKLFPAEFENGIPKGWRLGTVANLGRVICGKTPSTAVADNFGSDIPFVTIPDMHGKVFVTKTFRYLSNKGADTQENKYLPAKSICVSCIATAGLVSLTSETSQTNQQINSVVPNSDFGTYFCYQVLDKLGQEIRTKGSGGSVFVNLNTGSFSRISVLLPDEISASCYEDAVKPLFEKMLINERENQSLKEIRDSLLPRLISGRIRVNLNSEEIE